VQKVGGEKMSSNTFDPEIYNRKWLKERYEKRKAEHRCVDCGAPLPDDRKLVNCAECAVKKRERNRAYYHTQKTKKPPKEMSLSKAKLKLEQAYALAVANEREKPIVIALKSVLSEAESEVAR
jgi:hypothetical protein